MLVNEARWLGRAFQQLDPSAISPMINLGSASEEFRRVTQPHIHDEIIGPLEDRGVKIVHSDLFDGNGVDVAGSIFEPAVCDKLQSYAPKSIICSNMFEHVTDRPLLARTLDQLLPIDGILTVTVPFSFPYHPDPIDNYFRPNVEQICGMFPGYVLEQGEIVECGSLISRYRADIKFMTRQILGSLVPFPPRKWVRNLHHWCWIARPYKTACAIIRKRSHD